MNTHHRQIIIGLSPITMALYCSCKCFYHLTRGVEISLAQNGEQTIVAKLLQTTVFSLVETIGIDKDIESLGENVEEWLS